MLFLYRKLFPVFDELNKNQELAASKIAEKYIHQFAYIGIAFNILYGLFTWVAFANQLNFLANLGSSALLLGVIYIRKQQYISRLIAENLLISICYFTLLFIIFRSGGILSPIIPWFAIMNSVSLTVINRSASIVWTLIGLVVLTGIWILDFFFHFQFPNDFHGALFPTWVFLSSWGLLVLSLVIAQVIDARNEVLIHSLHSKNEELEQTRKKLEEVQQFKEQFFANVSHELRTPLSAIKGISQLLTDNENETERKELIEGLKKSSDHLLVLINDILDFSKLNAGKLLLKREAFSIAATIKNAHQLLAVQARQKGIGCHLQMEALPPLCFGDDTRLTQIIMNLAGNAIKFTGVGSVAIQASYQAHSESSGSLKIKVIDTGIGIADDKLPIIYEDYSQADAATASTFGGTGLGLSITKRLVQLHNGELACTSKLGKGTTFEVVLPYTIATAMADPSIEKPFDKLIEKPLRILIADDNAFNLMVAEKFLLKGIPNALLFKATNGQEALQLVQLEKPDLVLMDVKMPVMDGIAACELIRSDNYIQQPIIIALTANTGDTDIQRCLNAGMNDVLSKPFQIDDMLTKIKQWCLPQVTQKN